jgi:uncharacterized protein
MSTALIVFAKAPVAGLAKTRLIPALGPDGAAQLAERLLAHTLQQALALPLAHLELCVTPSDQHPAFEHARAAAAGRLQITLQGEGDLGARMHRALSRALSSHSKAVLVGTDAPALDTARLAQAQQALDTHPAVFVPALDGGYALVGLTQPAPALFEGMVWSTPQVMQDTRLRARAIGLAWTELPPVADIDEPADLVHLPLNGW